MTIARTTKIAGLLSALLVLASCVPPLLFDPEVGSLSIAIEPPASGSKLLVPNIDMTVAS